MLVKLTKMLLVWIVVTAPYLISRIPRIFLVDLRIQETFSELSSIMYKEK